MDLSLVLIQALNAVQYGLLLFLVASGLTLIFGVMGVINLAHGSFYMMGAYLAFSLAPLTGNLLTTVVIGLVLSACSALRLVRYSNGPFSRTFTGETTCNRYC